MSSNLIKAMRGFTEVVDNFEGRLALIERPETGSDRLNLNFINANTLMSHLLALFGGSKKADRVIWNQGGSVVLPASFDPISLEKEIKEINKSVAALQDVRHKEFLAAPSFDLVNTLLSSFSFSSRGMDANFWRSIHDRRIGMQEVNILHRWMDLILRLKNALKTSFVELFDFIEFSKGDARYAPELRESYLESFLSVSKTQIPRHYALATELIHPTESADFLPAWQTSISDFLSKEEKKKLALNYHSLMSECYNEKFLQASLDIMTAASRAVLLGIKKELDMAATDSEKASKIAEAKAKIFGIYTHFSMLIAVHCPVKLIDFDRNFQKNLGLIFPENHWVNQSSGRLLSGSLRQEYVKFLLMQQIVLSAGNAFRSSQEPNSRMHLDLAVQYLQQHRTWWGRIAKIIFGYKTQSHRLYESYQQTLDPEITSERKDELTDSIQRKFFTRMRGLRHRLGVDDFQLLEEKHPEQVTVHRKGLSIRSRSAEFAV